MKRFGEIVVKSRVFIVLAAIILLIPSVFGYLSTRVNYDIITYLPSDTETMKGQDILAKDFKMGSESIVAVDNMSSKQILDLEKKFKKIEGVNVAISANDLIGTTVPLEMLPEDLVSKFHKGETDLILVTFDDSTVAIEAIREMREITDESVKIGGMSASTLDTSILAEQEIVTYVLVAVALCLIVLMLALDSYLVPFLLLGNIGFAIVYNMGTNIFLGEISYITKAIAAVLQLGVTTDFSIFLYHKYEKAKGEYEDKKEAMASAIGETLVSIAGSSLTTIAGFLALCTMQLTLGTDIGIVMAKGVLLGVISTVTIFPAFLLVCDKWIDKTHHKPLIPQFTHIKSFVLKHYKAIVLVAVIIAIPAWYGNSHVENYYNITSTLPQDLASAVANNEAKEKFNMVSPEIILVDRNMKNDDINDMCNKIKNLKGIETVLSPAELADLNIPEEMMSDDLKDMFESDKYQMIYVNSLYETATDKLNNQVAKVNDIAKSYDKNSLLAGEGPCMKDMVEIAAQDFQNVNTASIAVIFVIMLFVLKSISLPVLLVAGIEVAIFINMSVPYYMNTTLVFVASIVIGTIQLGATIDYAILMTTKYLEQRKAGLDKIGAVKVALDNSVSSIFVSALCFFAATFGVGVVSKLDMISQLCTLMSRGAIISMVVAICVIPSLLLLFDKLIVKTTMGFKGLKEEKGDN